MGRRIAWSLVVSAFVLGGVWLLPAATTADTKCMCNNGTTVQSMDDDGDDATCEDACSMLGGGRVWDLERDRGVYVNDEVEVRGGAQVEHEAEAAHSEH